MKTTLGKGFANQNIRHAPSPHNTLSRRKGMKKKNLRKFDGKKKG